MSVRAPDLPGHRWLGGSLLVHPLGVSCRTIGSPSRASLTRADRAAGDEEALAGLRRALALGANLFDTSDTYGMGHSERLLGQLRRDCPKTPLLVSSKVGQHQGTAAHPYAAGAISRQLLQSLENLDAEYLDVYSLESWDFGEDDQYLAEAVDLMHTLKDLGHIKAIGLRGPGPCTQPHQSTTDSARFLHLFHAIAPDVVWAPFNGLTFAPVLAGEDLFAFTARRDVGLLIAQPLAGGILAATPPPRPQATFSMPGAVTAGLHRLHHRFGGEQGVLSRIALRYCLQRGPHCAVLAGFRTERQITENYQSLGAPLTSDELAFAEQVYNHMRDSAHGGTKPLSVPLTGRP